MKTVVGYWYCGASTELGSESLSKRGRTELSSYSLGLETGVMESTADAAMMDPTAGVAAAKSASYSKADSSST
jgi:hypothetical protein